MFWTIRPQTAVGWSLVVVAAIVSLHALVVILRDARRNGFDGWDIAAVGFVVLGGPGAAVAFLVVHDVLERRDRRRERRTASPAAGPSTPCS